MTSKNGDTPVLKSPTRKPRRHCNTLDGKRWLQNSISVWSDIRKTSQEARLKHPAMFPQMLVERLIETFLPTDANFVLDPFAGSGTTILAAEAMGKKGIGLELSPEYVSLARSRLEKQAEVRGQESGVRNQGSVDRNPKSSIGKPKNEI